MIAHNTSKDAHPNGFNLGSDHVFHLYASKAVSSNPSDDNIGDVCIHDKNGARLVVFGADTLLFDNGKSYIKAYIGTFDDINNKFVGNISIGTERNPSNPNKPDQYFTTSGEMRWCSCTDPTAPKQLANKQYVDSILDKIYPVGIVVWCKNAAACPKIGTWEKCTQLIGRYPLGDNSGGLTTVSASLPYHTHYVSDTWSNTAPVNVQTVIYGMAGGATINHVTSVNAHTRETSGIGTNSSIYSGATGTVTPPSAKLIPYIRTA